MGKASTIEIAQANPLIPEFWPVGVETLRCEALALCLAGMHSYGHHHGLHYGANAALATRFPTPLLSQWFPFTTFRLA